MHLINKILNDSDHKICSYCNRPFNCTLWCKGCDPRRMMEGWSSGNSHIDKFIKDTIYDVRHDPSGTFLEWVLFNKITNIKQIGEGGFSKVYSAIWIDGKSSYKERDDGNWEKLESEPIKVALKKLNGSQNMSDNYLNKIKIHWNLYLNNPNFLKFYGMTKDPETEEFILILQFVNMGNLRDVLSNNFNYILWKDKIKLLHDLVYDLQDAHRSNQIHKNFHSGNILRNNSLYHISDFGLSGSVKGKLDKIYGVLPYIAPEVLSGNPYTSSADIYSFGIIMVELSSGYPPFHDRKHDINLALNICNGLRPEFGSETPNIYKKLAHRCMNADPNERPKVNELYHFINSWNYILYNDKVLGHEDEKIQKMFSKKILNILPLYEKNPDAIYISREFTFYNLPMPVNLPTVISYYLKAECSYCNKPFDEELWCKECDPYHILEGWTSEDHNIDKFIKDTIYNARNKNEIPKFLEWVPFNKFTGIKQIGKGGFSEVYFGIWKRIKNRETLYFEPMRVALKKLNGSQNISNDYLNKIKAYWKLCLSDPDILKFYGMTRDPKTKEFIMILQFANKGALRNILSNNFNNILWKDKIKCIRDLVFKLQSAHKLGYFHKNLHSGNLLQLFGTIDTYIADFGLTGPANEQNSDDKIYGVLPYIAPEVLIGKPYMLSSEIYSFGVIMVELSSGYPPFHDRKHDFDLAFDICNGLRPKIGRGTPDIYVKLAHKCMNANPNERPKAKELSCVLNVWNDILNDKILDCKGKKIKTEFNKADKEIPNISTLYTQHPNAKYISREFTFRNLPTPVNSSSNALYLECSFCKIPFIKELPCKECDPYCVLEGWTSGNHDIDKFIKDTIYNARSKNKNPTFLEWVSFDKFTDMKQIGEGGFAKVYSAIWADGKPSYKKQDDGSWEKLESGPIKVALKKLNESQNMSAEYLNELKIHWELYLRSPYTLNFYGMTKEPETNDFMMILQFANNGSLRNVLSKNFNKMLWKDKIKCLYDLIYNLQNAHKLGYFHKDFHSGNLLQNTKFGITDSYIANFGLSGPASEQKSSYKIYGVLPYIAPEVLNEKPYTSSSDIYSFGVVMAELSSGKPPFHDRKHDLNLALEICNGRRPEFGKGTPDIYKKLSYRCMNANPDERPSSTELHDILKLWYSAIRDYKVENSGGKDIKTIFDEADKEIPNILTSYKTDAIYASRAFSFNNLPKPVNSTMITSYINEESYEG